MVRRIENAQERFGKSAVELFRVHGYAETTVSHIAMNADLTERTFYRYFTDKAEVLFWRAGELEEEIIEVVERATDPKPLKRVIEALEAAGCFFDSNRTDVITRQKIITAHDDLQERELMKMNSLAVALSAALRRQGVSELCARMVAEAGTMIWRVAIDRWCADISKQKFSHHVHTCLMDLVYLSHEMGSTGSP